MQIIVSIWLWTASFSAPVTTPCQSIPQCTVTVYAHTLMVR